jgi:hypothetical protein
MLACKVARVSRRLLFGLCVITAWLGTQLIMSCMGYHLTTEGLKPAQQSPHFNDSATQQAVENLKSTRNDLRQSLICEGWMFLLAASNMVDGIRLFRLSRNENCSSVVKLA